MKPALPAGIVEGSIIVLRGRRVLLDDVLAGLYEVEIRALVQATKRNRERFPPDFMFQLTKEEWRAVMDRRGMRHGRGGRRTSPYAFTEQGIAMLSSVLESPRAVIVNIEIMRAFVRFRRSLASHDDLARRLDELEAKYDEQFRVVFEAIRQLMLPTPKERKPVGFEVPHTDESDSA